MATVVRWDPWRELAGVERQFDELFGRMGRQGSRPASAWAPALDVHQDGDTMVVRAEIPGVSPDDVDVTIDDNVLTISGQRQDDRTVEEGQWIRRERWSGQFRRSISLPPGVDPGKVKASADNGVIEIRVPRPTRNEPHRVQLSGGNGKQEVDVSSKSIPTKSTEAASTETRSTETKSDQPAAGKAKKATKSSRSR